MALKLLKYKIYIKANGAKSQQKTLAVLKHVSKPTFLAAKEITYARNEKLELPNTVHDPSNAESKN